MSLSVLMAAVTRTGDVGIDLPAGASACSLQPTDYHPVDMEPEERVSGGMTGLDVPAGRSARELRPEDYKVIVTETM